MKTSYADDVKIYRAIESSSDAQLLEEDLQRVEQWCERNSMSLNISKCEVITFTRRQQSNVVTHDYQINGSHLQRVERVKDLGVILDNRMTFKCSMDMNSIFLENIPYMSILKLLYKHEVDDE